MTDVAQVLLIDDDPDILMLTRMAFELDGHDVVSAANGHDGLDLLGSLAAADRLPVVVLDVQMPDIDGWEVLDRIRHDDALHLVPVVMCTVRAGSLDRERGYGLGADAYEAKPFDLDQLLGTVRRLHDMDPDQLLARRARLSQQIAGSEETV